MLGLTHWLQGNNVPAEPACGRPGATSVPHSAMCFADINRRSRSWVFTINNPTSLQEELIKHIHRFNNAQYITFGYETGEKETPHLQGYVHFKEPRTRAQVNKIFQGTAFVEIRRGTIKQAIDYCHKDGKIVEYGTRPIDKTEASTKGGESNKQRWIELLTLGKAGQFQKIQRLFPREWIFSRPQLLSLYKPDYTKLEGELPHEWWIGPTGTGKSSTAWELYPNHYGKSLNKWWDNYFFEDVVIVEEWSPDNDCTASALKKWADRFPYEVEIKRGSLPRIRPRKIIVLSNYTIRECFKKKQDYEPLERRFTVINFPDERLRAVARKDNFEPMNVDIDEAQETVQETSIACDEILAETDTEEEQVQHLELPDLDFNFNTEELDTLLNFWDVGHIMGSTKQ